MGTVFDSCPYKKLGIQIFFGVIEKCIEIRYRRFLNQPLCVYREYGVDFCQPHQDLGGGACENVGSRVAVSTRGSAGDYLDSITTHSAAKIRLTQYRTIELNEGGLAHATLLLGQRTHVLQARLQSSATLLSIAVLVLVSSVPFAVVVLCAALAFRTLGFIRRCRVGAIRGSFGQITPRGARMCVLSRRRGLGGARAARSMLLDVAFALPTSQVFSHGAAREKVHNMRKASTMPIGGKPVAHDLKPIFLVRRGRGAGSGRPVGGGVAIHE